MNRKKQLLKNFFSYGFAEFISKIMPFLCLPLITRLMPDTAAFGVFNMFTVVSGIGVSLIVLNLNTAVFRDYFVEDEYQKTAPQKENTVTSPHIPCEVPSSYPPPRPCEVPSCDPHEAISVPLSPSRPCEVPSCDPHEAISVPLSPSPRKTDITTTGQRLVLYNSLIFSSILILFNQFFSKLFFNDTQYSLVIIFSGVAIFFSANNYLIELPSRLQNHRRIFIFSKILSSVGYYGVILLLIYLGFTYYSIIFASIFTAVILMIFFAIKNKKFFQGKFDKIIAKNLLKTGLPLVPTSIMYWIYSGISIMLISHFLDMTELGIYSFGSKIARIGHILSTVLIGGMTHFIYSTMKDKDYKTMIGKLWELMFAGTTSFYLIMFLCKDFIFNSFFQGDYLKGVDVFPYLLLVPLFGFLKFFFLTQFTIIKKPIYHFITIFADCLILIILSYILLPQYGIVGVAIANVSASFLTMFGLVVSCVWKQKLISFRKNTYFLLILFSFLFIIINFFDFKILNFIAIFSYFAIALYLAPIRKGDTPSPPEAISVSLISSLRGPSF